MKILMFVKGRGTIRSLDSTLRLLLDRGHRVHVALEDWAKDDRVSPTALVDSLAAQSPRLSHGPAPGREKDRWATLGGDVALSVDYLRYLEPVYRGAPKLRARAAREAPGVIRRLGDGPLGRARIGRAMLGRSLRLMERALPTSAAIAAYLRGHRPDAVLVSPLVDLGSPQAEYVRGARALGVPTVLCVRSWDNLTNKGLIRQVPDLVTVWNEAMKREAVELHGVPPGRVVVTGAPIYDHWFSWRRGTTRLEFCERVGLRADRPFLLYVCSSGFIAPGSTEARFIRHWISCLRRSDDARLREVGVLVRPHPLNAAQWQKVDLCAPGDVAVWPRGGAVVVDDQSKADFFDSMAHCAAVVGVNTSALIESAIVGRPVHTLLAPEFRDTQGGTLHFHHLLRAGGGLLRVAETFEEHARQLAVALEAEDGQFDEENRRFLEAFVRPHGLAEPASPRVAAAIEGLAAGPTSRLHARLPGAALIRPLLAPLASYSWRRQTRRRRQSRRGERPSEGSERAAPAGPA